MPQVMVGLIRRKGIPKSRCDAIADRLLEAFPGKTLPSGMLEVIVDVAEGGPSAEAQVDKIASEADAEWRACFAVRWRSP
jgi:hypothetical protein